VKAIVTLTRTETYIIDDESILTGEDAEAAARFLWNEEGHEPAVVDVTMDDRVDMSTSRTDN
jgi:hypothetical protein